MTDKGIQETVTRLKAYAECFRKKTRGTTPIEECNKDLCDGCELLYAQGTVGEHLKDIETAIRVLEEEPCEDAVSRNAITKTLNEMDRYIADELTLCGSDNKFPKNEVFIVDDVYEQIVEQLSSVTDKMGSTKDIQLKPLSKEHREWIPVSERLPETDEDVLITDGVTVYIGWINATNRQWRANSENNCFINNVIAWMPLPEPYKVESEE